MRKFGTIEVPVFGQGTWRMEQDDRAQAIRALQVGIERGMTHIDTAELYGDGVVEETIVRPAIEGRRDGLYLVSKVKPWNASRTGTVESCEASLSRLGVEQLDAYLLHWPGEHALEETFAAMESLEAAGKIASWGVSNFPAPLLERAVALAGPGRIRCNQVLHHLGERDVESNLLAACKRHAVTLVSYSPLGAGEFPVEDETLGAVARAHGVTPQQVALAFLREVDPNILIIPKSSKEVHVRENADAMTLVLAPEERASIEAAFPRGPATDRLPSL